MSDGRIHDGIYEVQCECFSEIPLRERRYNVGKLLHSFPFNIDHRALG